MRLWHLMIVSLLVFHTGKAVAGEHSYTCQVHHIYDLSENAVLTASAHEKEMKGSSITVSRVSGEITGEVVPTIMAKSTRIINQGSKDNSFKAIAEFDGQVQVLEVQEFRSGPIKPFIASSMGGVGIVTGTCK
jgi:hypothetical protein